MPTTPASLFPASLFLDRLIAFLLPYFTAMTADTAAARAEALETLVSYGARTRAELLCSVQIIVFSFAALETLAEAAKPDLSASMRIRFRGCANNLSRSSQKTEQTLARRLACDAPEATDTQAEPIIDISEADAEQIMRDTQAAVQAYRDRASGTQAAAADRSTSNPEALTPAAPTPAAPTPAAANAPAQTPPSTSRPADAVTHPATGKQPAVSLQMQQPGPVLLKPPGLRPQDSCILLTDKEKNQRLWGAAMMDTLAQMGMPVKPASGS